jgi:hypothetical protein
MGERQDANSFSIDSGKKASAGRRSGPIRLAGSGPS